MFILTGYQLQTLLAETATTRHYRALRLADQQSVIVKILSTQYPSEADLLRFRQAFELQARFNHPNIAKVYSLERLHNSLAMISEDFNGIPLKNLIQNASLNFEEHLAISVQIAEILCVLHSAGITHKDINPYTLAYNPFTEQCKITDFSFASVLPLETPSLRRLEHLTGTLEYMSPEQTGRMNRPLDYRTDFYSLGVTLYELFIGELPFNSKDSLELVHAHLARPPIHPRQYNPHLSESLANIILKLLAKTADERYQSAWGIKADLQHCWQQWLQHRQIPPFELALQDVSNHLQIPNRLYGRQAELEQLTEIISFIGHPEGLISPSLDPLLENEVGTPQLYARLVLISGYEGIGKTALIQQLRQKIGAKGYFITGKAAPFLRDLPYHGLIAAMRDLLQQLLTENESQLQFWQTQLLTALGNNAEVLLELIPEMNLVINVPETRLSTTSLKEEVSGLQARNRFQFVWTKVLQVFARSPQQPLILFLDDMQWVDNASIKLLEALLTQVQNLIVIIAYRDNELTQNNNQTHPLQAFIDNLPPLGISHYPLAIPSLTLSHITTLIADTLHHPIEAVQELAALIAEKTHGNPFFINEFLKTLYQDKLIYFVNDSNASDSSTHWRGWQWNIQQIKQRDLTDNVVELLSHEIKKLSQTTQHTLQLAACIGNQFALETLAQVSQMLVNETSQLLQEAVRVQLILPIDSNSQLSLTQQKNQRDKEQLINEHYSLITEYRFAHERIQQAAYHLLSEPQRQAIHERVGQWLLSSIPQEKHAEQIFDIVNQLNVGQINHKCQEQLDHLAHLNLMAGQRARNSTAYEAALKYLLIGLDLLGEEGWQRCYGLMLSLTILAAEAAYLSGQFTQTEELVKTILQHGRQLLDKVHAYEIRMQACKAQNKPHEAVEIGLTVLKLLGIRFYSKHLKVGRVVSHLLTRLALSGRPIDSLTALPPMRDLEKQAAMRIMLAISPPVYAVMPNLLNQIICKRVRLSIAYGNTPDSIAAYASYGYLLCERGEIELGYRFGQLALTLLERSQIPSLKARVLQIVHGVISHYKIAVRDTLPPLLEAYQSGLETGNFEYAIASSSTYIMHAYFVGKDLSVIEQEIHAYTAILLQLRQHSHLHVNRIYQQAILNLICVPPTVGDDVLLKKAHSEAVQADMLFLSPLIPPTRLIGDCYNEQFMLPQHQQNQARGLIFQVYLHKLILCVLFHEIGEGLANADQAERYADAVISSLLQPVFYFYDALIHIAGFMQVRSTGQRRAFMKRIKRSQHKLHRWAIHAPMNYEHKYRFICAELARLSGDYGEAREYYDQAIKLAQQHEYVNEEALFQEWAGRFYWQHGYPHLAHVYLNDSRYAYQRWGCIAKVHDVEQRYALLFANLPEFSSMGSKLAKLQEQHIPTYSATLNLNSQGQELKNITEELDLHSVLKASQAFSGEIILNTLLSKLMIILLESAGAQRGVLVLQRNNQWLIEAQATVNIEGQLLQEPDILTLQDLPIEDNELVAAGIIYYVARTLKSLVLANASQQGRFIHDPYILKNNPKSILCAPLLNRGKLNGIIYLENNLIQGAFTTKQTHLLNMLSSQIAIAIENARLYSELEEKVRVRTQALSEKNVELIRLNQEKSELLGIAAHDLKNPLSGITGLADVIELEIDSLSKQEILSYIELIQKSAQQMFDLITNLLDVNRIEAGGLVKYLTLIDLKLVVQDLVDEYQQRAKTKRINLQLVAPFPQYVICADYKMLRQVLDNLISNAIKYSPFDKTVTICLRHTEQESFFIIQDEGKGLTPEDKQKLFGKFTRLSAQPTGNESSTGLGLFIVKRLVEAMGARVWAESEIGLGATFIVAFRLNCDDREKPKEI